MVFYVILLEFAFVGDHFVAFVVWFVCFLQQYVPAISFQAEDLFDVPGGPAFIESGI